MEAYRLFWVGKGKVKAGKQAEAMKWWKEKAEPDLRKDPWTVSVNAYAVQFGLGGDYTLEVWQEIENYAAFDAMDKKFTDDPEGSAATLKIWKEGQEYVDWGPSRLMGDWPQSGLD